MPTIENLGSLSPKEALKALYFNTRQDISTLQKLNDRSLARDLKGNLLPNPTTGKPVQCDFVPIYQYRQGPEELRLEEQLKLKASIWNEMFGEKGYLINQTPKNLKEDMFLVELELALAEYAHQEQQRATGESFTQHPFRALLEYIKDKS